MLFALRVELPNRRGTLAKVAARIAAAGGDIVRVEILGELHGRAVDEFLVLLPQQRVAELVTGVGALPAVTVLAVRPSAALPGFAPEVDLVLALIAAPERAIVIFTDLAPLLLGADWAAAVEAGPAGALVHATPGCPTDLPRLADLPPRAAPIRGAEGIFAVVSVPVRDRVVLVGRDGGPEFHELEVLRLQRVAELATTLVAELLGPALGSTAMTAAAGAGG